jgi:hypothetical protein
MPEGIQRREGDVNGQVAKPVDLRTRRPQSVQAAVAKRDTDTSVNDQCVITDVELMSIQHACWVA